MARSPGKLAVRIGRRHSADCARRRALRSKMAGNRTASTRDIALRGGGAQVIWRLGEPSPERGHGELSIEVLGFVAAAVSIFCVYISSTMIPLRIAAVVANALLQPISIFAASIRNARSTSGCYRSTCSSCTRCAISCLPCGRPKRTNSTSNGCAPS